MFAMPAAQRFLHASARATFNFALSPRVSAVTAATSIASVRRALAAPLTVRAAAWQQAAGSAGSAPVEPLSTSADEPEASAAASAATTAASIGLREENEKLKASVAELNAARLRLLAEMENVRRIARADVEAAKAYALQSFAKRLLDVADNLGRAVATVPTASRAKPAEGAPASAAAFHNLFEGVAATEKELLKALASVGIEAFGAVGDKFDPNCHEAMLQVPASEANPAGTVAALLKGGFRLKDRVLRAAQVTVATAA